MTTHQSFDLFGTPDAPVTTKAPTGHQAMLFVGGLFDHVDPDRQPAPAPELDPQLHTEQLPEPPATGDARSELIDPAALTDGDIAGLVARSTVVDDDYMDAMRARLDDADVSAERRLIGLAAESRLEIGYLTGEGGGYTVDVDTTLGPDDVRLVNDMIVAGRLRVGSRIRSMSDHRYIEVTDLTECGNQVIADLLADRRQEALSRPGKGPLARLRLAESAVQKLNGIRRGVATLTAEAADPETLADENDPGRAARCLSAAAAGRWYAARLEAQIQAGPTLHQVDLADMVSRLLNLGGWMGAQTARLGSDAHVADELVDLGVLEHCPPVSDRGRATYRLIAPTAS